MTSAWFGFPVVDEEVKAAIVVIIQEQAGETLRGGVARRYGWAIPISSATSWKFLIALIVVQTAGLAMLTGDEKIEPAVVVIVAPDKRPWRYRSLRTPAAAATSTNRP